MKKISIIFLYCLYLTTLQTNAQTNNIDYIFPIYQLSKQSTAVVINLPDEDAPINIDQPNNKIIRAFNQIDQEEKLSEEYFESVLHGIPGEVIHMQYYDTTGIYKLLYNKQVETKLAPFIEKELYIYGTKGYTKKMIQKIVFGFDACRTNIIAFIIDQKDTLIMGQPLIASTKPLHLKNNQTEIEQKDKIINAQQVVLNSNFKETTPLKIFASDKSIYYVFQDDFKWKNSFSYQEKQTKFPTRAIIHINKENQVETIWYTALDLIGLPCLITQ